MPGGATTLPENRRLHERPNASLVQSDTRIETSISSSLCAGFLAAVAHSPRLVVPCPLVKMEAVEPDRIGPARSKMKTGGLNHAEQPSHRHAGT